MLESPLSPKTRWICQSSKNQHCVLHAPVLYVLLCLPSPPWLFPHVSWNSALSQDKVSKYMKDTSQIKHFYIGFKVIRCHGIVVCVHKSKSLGEGCVLMTWHQTVRFLGINLALSFSTSWMNANVPLKPQPDVWGVRPQKARLILPGCLDNNSQIDFI